MTGYVHTINRRRGLVAIHEDGDGFTIVELPGSDPINLGDRLEWEDDRLGTAVYANHTKGTQINVNVQAHGVAEPRVRPWLKL
jgi:hypothetical protein